MGIQDETPSTGEKVLKLWRTWLIAVLALIGVVVAAMNPELMGEGLEYEGMFGFIAVVAIIYGLRKLNERHRQW